ncbi:hypothetical protein JCM1841_002844 [Sporobolomyces salmonicolor]
MGPLSLPTPALGARSPSRTFLAHLLLLTAVLSLLPPTQASFFSKRAPTPRPSFVPDTVTAGDFVCRAAGLCEPCPPSELSSPVCRLWGNRRPLQCIPRRPPSTSSSSTTLAANADADADAPKLFPAAATSSPSSSSSSSSVTAATAATEGGDGDALAAGEAGDAYDLPHAAHEAGISLEEAELQDALAHDRRRRRPRPRPRPRRRRSPSRARQVPLEAYEACPRVVPRERADFFEFVLCNLFFACAALSVLVYRQRTLAGRQFGKLAARIMRTEVRGGGP